MFDVKNNGSDPIDWEVAIGVEGAVSSLWCASYEIVGTTLTARGLSWNDVVNAGQKTSFGFCAVR